MAALRLRSALDALIENAKAERAHWETRVSREQSRPQAMRRPDKPALELKAVASASPSFGKNERATEASVARMFDILEIRHPDPKMRSADFKRIFAVDRTPDQDELPVDSRGSACLPDIAVRLT